MGRVCSRVEEGRSAFKILTGKPTGKRPLGRPWRRWEDNIRMDLKGNVKVISWIDSAQSSAYWIALVLTVSKSLGVVLFLQIFQ